jgi:hypothetical protein
MPLFYRIVSKHAELSVFILIYFFAPPFIDGKNAFSVYNYIFQSVDLEKISFCSSCQALPLGIRIKVAEAIGCVC